MPSTQRLTNLVFEPKTDDPGEYWKWIGRWLGAASTLVPLADNPYETIWHHPDEAWKDRLAAESLERDCRDETDEAMLNLLRDLRWKRRARKVAFYVRKRLRFGIEQAALFATKSNRCGRSLCYARDQERLELLLWLTTDLYFASPGK